MNRIAVIASALGLLAACVATTSAVAAPNGGTMATACNPAGKDVVSKSGSLTTTFCGPATATVKLGGKTLTFSKGTCVWTDSSLTLELGKILFPWSKPFSAKPGFVIHAAGYPVARAVVTVYWQGKRTELTSTRTTARPSGGFSGGTFDGRTAAGARVTGTVKCG